jgi:hypothetical protein
MGLLFRPRESEAVTSHYVAARDDRSRRLEQYRKQVYRNKVYFTSSP